MKRAGVPVDPGFTLRTTYAHLVEDGAERSKRAVDSVFGHRPPEPDSGDAQPDGEELHMDMTTELVPRDAASPASVAIKNSELRCRLR